MGRQGYEIVGYTGGSGKCRAYKMIGKAKSKFDKTKERAHLQSFDGSIDFWVDMEKIEAAPPRSEASRAARVKRGGCSCSDGCCDYGCRCGPECNCQGGPIYDC